MTSHAMPLTAALLGLGRRALEPLLVLFAAALLVATLGGCDAGSGSQSGVDEPAASFSSDVGYRIVNVLADNDGNRVSLDAYVSEPGLTRAIPFVNELAYGQASDSFPTPADGNVIVVQTGAPDPMCTGECPYTMATSNIGAGQGTQRLLVVYNGGSLEVWADGATSTAGGVALASPDATAALVSVVAPGIADAELRIALEGTAGCAPAAEPVVVSGDAVQTFQLSGPASPPTRLSVHAGSDSDCSGDAISDPVTVSATPGNRYLLVLVGETTAVKVVKLSV